MQVMKPEAKNVRYIYRDKVMSQVKIPKETRDRVAEIADQNGVTIGFQAEQMLKKQLESAEKTAAN